MNGCSTTEALSHISCADSGHRSGEAHEEKSLELLHNRYTLDDMSRLIAESSQSDVHVASPSQPAGENNQASKTQYQLQCANRFRTFPPTRGNLIGSIEEHKDLEQLSEDFESLSTLDTRERICRLDQLLRDSSLESSREMVLRSQRDIELLIESIEIEQSKKDRLKTKEEEFSRRTKCLSDTVNSAESRIDVLKEELQLRGMIFAQADKELPGASSTMCSPTSIIPALCSQVIEQVPFAVTEENKADVAFLKKSLQKVQALTTVQRRAVLTLWYKDASTTPLTARLNLRKMLDIETLFLILEKERKEARKIGRTVEDLLRKEQDLVQRLESAETLSKVLEKKLQLSEASSTFTDECSSSPASKSSSFTSISVSSPRRGVKVSTFNVTSQPRKNTNGNRFGNEKSGGVQKRKAIEWVCKKYGGHCEPVLKRLARRTRRGDQGFKVRGSISRKRIHFSWWDRAGGFRKSHATSKKAHHDRGRI